MRFSRDKRGYELFSLVQSEQRGGQSRPRVLYAFRTPPNIKVGRDPFDDETRRSLEQLYPGVGFNWRQITETPIPAADAIDWRERRRAMKEAKQAQKREEAEEQPPAASAEGPNQPAPPGESVSARRRRRRRGRGQRPEAVSPVDAGSTEVSSDAPSSSHESAEGLSSEARSSSHESEGGSEIPETPQTATEPDPSS